jgi:glutamate-ammonia-ligase adenylyltransferase
MTALSPFIEEAARDSADPEGVRLVFARLSDERPDELGDIDKELARSVAAVAGASHSLARLVLADGEALAALRARGDAVQDGPGGLEQVRRAADAAELSRNRHLAYLRIAGNDLTGATSLDETGAALSRLADAVLAAGLRLAEPEPGAELAVIGMGKHGAEELNYASDVDIIFVAGNGADLERASAAARRLLSIVSGSFRVDTDLRPEGRDGALVRSLDSYEAYWESWARPWEFQALVKARASAGATELGRAFEESAARAIWTTPIDADALAELRSMKGRAEELVARRGLSERELKRGRGGIRDIEFAAQLLQLVHGRQDPALRVRSTLGALEELAAAGYIDAGDASELALSYRFLRTVEHRLQLLEGAQVHTVPAPGPQRDRLARVLALAPGLPALAPGPERSRGVRTRSQRFDTVLARYQSSARTIHERLFFRPLLEVFAAQPGVRARLSEQAATERLAAFGFREAERTRQALSELTRGLTRSSRLMQQLLPVLLGWLSETPDPDGGLLALRNLAATPHQRDVVVAAFRDSPELARRLCVLLGTSRRLADLTMRHPSLALRLGDDAELAASRRPELVERALVVASGDPARAAGGIRRLVGEETVRIAAGDVLLGRGAEAPEELAALADATVTAALRAADPRLSFAIVAMGRLGGSQLCYGSDLDLLFVYSGAGAADAKEAERAATTTLRILNGATPAERIWTADASLRPEGRHGPLARSLEAFAEYHERWISAWERQALVRARPLAGDEEVLAGFMALVDQTVWGQPFTAEDVRETRRLKARTERERIPAGEDAQFHFKLGKGSLADVEWTTQLLQLESSVPGPKTREALRSLRDAAVLDEHEWAALGEALGYLEATRNRWHLVGNFVAGAGGPITRTGSDSLPHSPEALSRLARSLGKTPVELRERYRQVTRRARRVVERRFYGL